MIDAMPLKFIVPATFLPLPLSLAFKPSYATDSLHFSIPPSFYKL